MTSTRAVSCVATERLFRCASALYERSLRWVLAHQRFTLLVAIATLVATICSTSSMPKGLLPQQDTGLIIGVTDAAQNISFKAMVARASADLRYRAQGSGCGQSSPLPSAPARSMRPSTPAGSTSCSSRATQRDASARKSSSACATPRSNIEGISLFMQAAQDLQIDAASAARSISTFCRMPIAAELTDLGAEAAWKAWELPELSDVASDQQANGLQLNVDIDREKASRLNVLTQAIDDTLYDAFGQRQVSIIFTQLNQFRVILEVEPNFRDSPDVARQDLREIEHRPARAAERLRHHARSNTPLSIPHQGQFPAATISFNCAVAARLVTPFRRSKKRSNRSACRIQL